MSSNERDPALDKAWREHARETPPPALDAKILAAAHRAVDSKPRAATGAPRWWMPLMAAAVVGVIAVGVIQLAPPPEPAIDTTSSNVVASVEPAKPTPPPAPASAPPPAEAPKAVAPPEAAPAKKQKEAMPRENKLAADRRAPEPFPASPPPPPAQKTEAAAFADSASGGAKRDLREEARKDAPQERQLAAAPPPPAPAAAAPAPAQPLRSFEADRARGQVGALLQKSTTTPSASEKARDPDAWIARIRKLRDEGQTAEALRELREFRDNVPDAEMRLPADLRDWKP